MKWMDIRRKHALPDVASALPGRDDATPVADRHAVLGTPLLPPLRAALRAGVVRHGVLLGGRAIVLANLRGDQYGSRLCSGANAQSDLSRSLLWSNWAQRSRTNYF